MSQANQTQRCEKCGAEFTASSSPLGLCPSCLFKLGMSDPAMTSPAQDPEPVGVATVTPVTTATPRFRLPSRVVWIAMAALLAIAAYALSFFLQPTGESITTHVNPVRFTLTLPDGMQIPEAAQFAVSPDGAHVVIAARRHDDLPRLWLRQLQSLEWRELPQTDLATFPFWSPDSRYIGFFAGKRVKRIDIGNNLTETLSDVDEGRGGTWSSQGVILFAGAGGLFRVPATGGPPEPIMPIDASRGEMAHLRPQFLPDGQRFTFLTRTAKDRSGTTYIGDLATGERVAIENARGPASFAAGELLVSRGSALTAHQFDVQSGQPIGEARTIAGVEDITADARRGSAFAASSTVLVYQHDQPGQRGLVWMDRRGAVISRDNDESTATEGFALSPDGQTLALVRRARESDESSLWLMEIGSSHITRVTWGGGRDEFPVWSPDSSRLAFSAERGDNQGTHIFLRDRNGMEESILQLPDAQLSDWSSDGRFLFYSARSPKTGSDLWMLPLNGDRKPQPLDPTPGNESQAVMSPDGRMIAYMSDESGRDEIYVRSFPPPSGRWQISIGGGTRPRWRGDGRELLYLSPDGHVMSVEVAAGSAPRYGAPQRLVVVPGADDFDLRGRDQLVVLMPVEHDGGRQLEVILNWASERRR